MHGAGLIWLDWGKGWGSAFSVPLGAECSIKIGSRDVLYDGSESRVGCEGTWEGLGQVQGLVLCVSIWVVISQRTSWLRLVGPQKQTTRTLYLSYFSFSPFELHDSSYISWMKQSNEWENFKITWSKDIQSRSLLPVLLMTCQVNLGKT